MEALYKVTWESLYGKLWCSYHWAVSPDAARSKSAGKARAVSVTVVRVASIELVRKGPRPEKKIKEKGMHSKKLQVKSCEVDKQLDFWWNKS
jgi:hypothetical protein